MSRELRLLPLETVGGPRASTVLNLGPLQSDQSEPIDALADKCGCAPPAGFQSYFADVEGSDDGQFGWGEVRECFVADTPLVFVQAGRFVALKNEQALAELLQQDRSARAVWAYLETLAEEQLVGLFWL